MIPETLQHRKAHWAEVWAGIAQMEAKLQAHKDFVAFMQEEYARSKVNLVGQEAEPQDVPTEQSKS